MVAMWIPLNSLPDDGLSLTVDDPEVWTGPIGEFGLPCTVRAPLRAELLLLAQPGGCLVRGRLSGTVSLPCDRCAEDAVITLDQTFDTFEPVPGADQNGEPEDIDERVMRLGDDGPEINAASLVWQEFSLALPVHPLCRVDCLGLCPQCGNNLNENACGCVREAGDPRLAALRGLKVTK